MKLPALAFIAFATFTLAACDPSSGTATPAAPGDPGSPAPETQQDAPCDQPLCLSQTVDTLELQDRPLDENVLKIFSAAADTANNRVYVSGIMSRDIAVLDGATEEWLGTIDSGTDGRGLKYLYADSAAGYLYVLDATHGELRRIHLDSGEIDGPVDVAGFLEGHRALVLDQHGLILISTRDAGIQAFGGDQFARVYANTSFGEATGALAYDPARDSVLVLDSAATTAQRTIHVLDAASGRAVSDITYAAAPNVRSSSLSYDQATGRLFVATERAVLVLRTDGSTITSFPLPGGRTTTDVLFDPVSGRVLALQLARPADGEVAGVGGSITAFDPSTGRPVAEVSFGRKPHRMTLNTASGHVYIPNGDASVVWSLDTRTFAQPEALRVGDSVEQVAVAADGSIYLSSRLGGSYLIELDASAGEFETFESGTWPIPVQATEDGERLLVLNAWDSTLSVYAAGEGHSLLGTVDLGIPDGSTDRLPSMAIDDSRSLAYIAYPEFGKIVVADFAQMKAVAAITLEGFKTGDTGGGPGQVQLTVDESRNRLIVLRTSEQVIEVYDGAAGYTLTTRVDRTALNWKLVPQAGELLFFDAARDRFFVGPIEVDAATMKPTGRTLATGLAIFAASDEPNAYWTIAAADGASTTRSLVIIDRDTLQAIYTEELPGEHLLSPVPLLDLAHGRLLIGHQVEAEVDIFRIGEIG